MSGDLVVSVGTSMLIITSILNVVLTIILLKKLSQANGDNAKLITKNQQLREENKEIKTTARRVFLIARRHDDDLECVKLQVAQLQHWLGEVLNISNLITPEAPDMTSIERLEEMRQRASWAKEVKNNTNDTDYYKGSEVFDMPIKTDSYYED